MIAIVDYGLGNIKAFAHVYKSLNISFVIAKHLDDLLYAKKLILPGVGAFDHAMEQLNNSGMRMLLDELVLNKKIPVLGVCVGMQMLANYSEEGKLPGLKWIDGEVKKLVQPSNKDSYYIPHMGWNNINPIKSNNLLNGLDENSRFYFLHSYYFHCIDSADSIAVTNYGIEFSSVVNRNNIYGVQFHPEKSHTWGVQVLKNFAEL